MKKGLVMVIALLVIGLTACTGKAQAQSSSNNSGVQVAQAGGTPAFVTRTGEVWADEEKDVPTFGLIFEADGRVLDVRKMDGIWYSQRENGKWSGNTWDNWTLSVKGNTLTCSYSYTNDEGEKRTDTVTYTKLTGQKIEIRH